MPSTGLLFLVLPIYKSVIIFSLSDVYFIIYDGKRSVCKDKVALKEHFYYAVHQG